MPYDLSAMPRDRAVEEPRLSRRRSGGVSCKERDTRAIPTARRREDGAPRDSSDPDSAELRLALAQLPGRLREATGRFRVLTGFTAVTSVMSPVSNSGGTAVISPPMHPMCVSRLHAIRSALPCEEEWQKHLRSGVRDHSVQRHTCPLELNCSCVPIHYGENLIGVAKCVGGPRTADRKFSQAVQTLELIVSKVCQDFQISAMSCQMKVLRERIAQLQEIQHVAGATRGARRLTDEVDELPGPALAGRSLIDQALDYIAQHYVEPNLSLAGISRALGVNGKYLTLLFSQVVGQHMRIYIQQLRVQHACGLILSTINRSSRLRLNRDSAGWTSFNARSASSSVWLLERTATPSLEPDLTFCNKF